MRKMKRLITLLMTVVMMMAMSITAFADNETTVSGKTFTFTNVGAKEGIVSYFRVIKPDTTNTTGWNFVEESYGTEFAKALEVKTAQDALDKLTEDPNTTIEAARGGALNAIVNSLPQGTNVWTSSTFKADNDSFTLTLKEAGYYVVALTDTADAYTYSLMSVSVAPSDLNGGTEPFKVKVKKTSNYVDKTIDEETDKYVELNDTVEYKITAKVPYFYENQKDVYFKIYDKLKGASFDSLKDGKVTVSVKVGDGQATEKEAVYTEATNSFVLDLTYLVKDATEKIVNTDAYKDVVITYTATVTSIQVANTAYPGYSENDPDDEYGDTVESFSGKVKVLKKDVNTELPLNGAHFALAKKNADGTYVLATKNNTNTITWTEDTYADAKAIIAAANATNSVVRTWETAGQGVVTIEGLDRDLEYAVFEVVAPEDYSINTAEFGVEFDEITEVTSEQVKEDVQEAGDLTVLDTKLTNLPFTGGMGTTIFTILGVAIMAMAAALFFATKKSHN